jgi:steroid 5-alpha reductase family enzyme
MPFSLLLVLSALAFVIVEMTATFLAARRLRNFGIVDVVWSFGFTPVVWIYVGLAAWRTYDAKLDAHPEWNWPAALTIAGLVTAWSLRLGAHLFVRVKSHHPVEDVRYAKLRQEWGAQTDRKMFGFFLLQGALQVVLSLPWLLVILDTEPARKFALSPLAWLGAGIWLAGLVGEAIADRQLAAFRANPANKGKVCQLGLWNYSRHPNYFFEWLIWVGYAVFALSAPWGWLGLLAPALMWHFLVNVTGIPMTEELSVKSKGDAYRDYQRTTSAFVPWLKRTSSAGVDAESRSRD